jgi:predicted phosphoribosyltransferase
VPIGPSDTCDILRGDADDVVCLYAQEPFEAVGLAYDDFRAVTDETVERLLREYPARAGA